MTRDERRAALKAQELILHDAYMASKPDSQEERTLELALEGVMAELDVIFHEEQAAWGEDDDRLIREHLADVAYGMML